MGEGGEVRLYASDSESEPDHGSHELEGASPPRPHAAAAELLTPEALGRLAQHGLVVLDAPG